MKKVLLQASLIACAILLSSCDGLEIIKEKSADSELAGTKLDLSGITTKFTKLFVLNEGGMGSNNSTLDFLRSSDATYVTGAFKKMNPTVGAGLGDVGNDVVVIGDEVWIVVNNAGIVEVISAKDEKEIKTISIPTPRNITFDDTWAYVTSWAGAYAVGSYDNNWSYIITDYKNPKGCVYRINLTTKVVDSKVAEVGYQPEGIACYGGKLYVANSGGIASQLPPAYSYDNTVSIVDVKTFTTQNEVEVVSNLKNVYSDNRGHIYVTALGDYYSVHSGLYMIDTADIGPVSKISDYVSASAICGDTVYWIGTDSEWDWNAQHVFKVQSAKGKTKADVAVTIEGQTPYGMAALSDGTLIVADAGDYFNPGTVSCYSKGAKVWSVGAGVCPGHFAIWY